jgi:hypothetical protein
MNNPNDTEAIAGLFLHIMTLRRKLTWIADTTSDPGTRMQVREILKMSLRMEESDGSRQGSD